MTAQEAALKELANGKLRSLLAYNKSSKCSDVKIGDAALFRKSAKEKSTPRRRGRSEILDFSVANIQGGAIFCARDGGGEGCG